MNPIHLQTLIQDFGFGQVISCVETEGVLNRNYVLTTTTGKYFIKSLREKMCEHVGYIATVESFMKDNGVRAVAMEKTVTGESFVVYDDSVYSVYPFIESDRRHVYTHSDIFALGAVLGGIHRVGSGAVPESLQTKRIKHKDATKIGHILQAYKKLIIEKENKEPIDSVFLECIELKLALIDTVDSLPEPDSFVLGHGDFHERNVLFDAQTRTIIGVCDWEKAEMVSPSFELARSAIIIVFNRIIDHEHYMLQEMKAFIDGYRSVFPLTAQEFRDGVTRRIHGMVLSKWLEELHYTKQDYRADHFLEKEMRGMRAFAYEGMTEKIIEFCFSQK